MAESLEARNKLLVLEAFDALFNRRDYVAAVRLLSPRYGPERPETLSLPRLAELPARADFPGREGIDTVDMQRIAAGSTGVLAKAGC